jgi:peptidoglycan L-alanyl-D-glutamate endopeptidase CwlK
MLARNQKIIDGLHPDNRESATAATNECDVVLNGRAKIVLIYGARTVKEQNDLHDLGRKVKNPDGYDKKKKPLGNIVTNARGFQSLHSPYGLAVDFALLIDGKVIKWDDTTDYDGDKLSDWMEIVAVWEKHGWEAGIRWKKFVDPPHFQKSHGYTWQSLKAMYEKGRFLPGTTYIDLARTPIEDVKIYRTTASVNLRGADTTASNVIMVVLKGETVRELYRKGQWSNVQYGSQVGWININYLTK